MKIAHYLLLLCTLLLLRLAPAEEPLTLDLVKEWATLPPTMIEGTVAITGEKDWQFDFRAYYDAESEAIRLSNKSGTVLMHYHPDFGGSHIWIDGRPDFFDFEKERLHDPISMFRPLVHFHYLAHNIENDDGRMVTSSAGTTTSGTVTVTAPPYGIRGVTYQVEHTILNGAITSITTTPSRPTLAVLKREFSDFDQAIPWLPRQVRITRQLASVPPEYTIATTIHHARAAESSEAALGELRAGLTQFWPPEIPPTTATTPAFRTAVTWIARGIAAVLVLIAMALYWHRRRQPV